MPCLVVDDPTTMNETKQRKSRKNLYLFSIKTCLHHHECSYQFGSFLTIELNLNNFLIEKKKFFFFFAEFN